MIFKIPKFISNIVLNFTVFFSDAFPLHYSKTHDEYKQMSSLKNLASFLGQIYDNKLGRKLGMFCLIIISQVM